jgi:hypothetical protein
MSWSAFWALVFYTSAGSAALVSLLIAVNGVSEIRELLAMLRNEKRELRRG